MASAMLEVQKQQFPLKSGAYLIRGPSALNVKEEHSLRIDDESVDDKHALIIAEADDIFLYDLNTRTGTFINEKRLEALSKCRISEGESIRFGVVEAKLNKCSILEQQRQSSSFRDESVHLQLDQTNEIENLTIPETQCVNPEECVYAIEKKDEKNTSNDISIPETQEVLQLPTTPAGNTIAPAEGTLQTPSSKDMDQESQFCITSQDFNDCLNASDDSNSRDFLDNINWLMDGEQPTTIKQTVKCTEMEQVQNDSKSDENNQNHGKVKELKNEATPFEIDAQQEELLRSQTHTPDLFDVGLLEDFEKKEARMINARAIRSQNDNAITAEAKPDSPKDVFSEEHTQTASEKSLIDKPVMGIMEKTVPDAEASIPTDVKNDNGEDNPTMEQSSSTNTANRANRDEPDLFEGKIFDDDEVENGNFIGQPLQHSNKENMTIAVASLGDLQPTQVYVSKKAMKPPKVIPPPKSATLIVPHPQGTLVGSDFEPTQVFLPKSKAKDTSSLILPAPNKKAVPGDAKDLEPTQKFVPKKSSKSESTSVSETKDVAIDLNSTMAPNAQNEPVKRSARSFFAEVNDSLQDEQQASNENTTKQLQQAMATPIMLTPELISKTFAQQKPPDTASRRELLSRPDFDSDSDDSLTRLLTCPRNPSDFDSLIDSIKKNEGSPSKQSGDGGDGGGKEQNDLMQKYIEKNESETPQKKHKVDKSKPVHLKNDDSATGSTSSRSVRSKRNAPEEPIIDNKRPKTKNKDDESLSNVKSSSTEGKEKMETKGKSKEGKAKTSSAEIKKKKIGADEKSKEGKAKTSSTENKKKNFEAIEKSKESETKPGRPKRTATLDESDVLKAKIKKSEANSSVTEASNTSSAAKEAAAKNSKASTAIEQEPELKKNRTRKASHSSTSSAMSKASSRSNNSGTATKLAKTESKSGVILRTSSRLRSQSSSVSSNSVQESQKSDEKRSQTTNTSSSTRNTRLKALDSASDATVTSDDNSTKNTKSRKERKDSNRKQETKNEPNNVLNSSIIEVQEKRVRSRAQSTVASSQIGKPKLDKMDKIDEMPTTSKATAKNVVSNEVKGGKKASLKVSFTMVEPEKKAELMKHANSKWEEAENAADSEILVMDTGNRTLKFLMAVAKGIPIVTSKWLEAIKATGVISVRSNYFFKDVAFERSFKFSLLHTLNEAKNARLFKNFQFLLTSNIVPSSNDMKLIITCAGGTILDKENIPKQKENQQLYLVSSEKDRQHWHSYRRKNANLCITNTESVMLAVMRYDPALLKKHRF